MDLVAEKKDSDSENHNSYARALIDSTTDINPKEAAADETQARELRAGLHPLKVFFFFPILWSDQFWVLSLSVSISVDLIVLCFDY